MLVIIAAHHESTAMAARAFDRQAQGTFPCSRLSCRLNLSLCQAALWPPQRVRC